MLEAACHIPPAFSQSARVLYLLKSLAALPEGLADGDVDEPLEELPLVAGDFVVSLPDELGLLFEPEGVDFEPLLVCAAASAGVRATRATKSITMSLCIGFPPLSGLPSGSFLKVSSGAAISGPS
jgi:hypothetical protein